MTERHGPEKTESEFKFDAVILLCGGSKKFSNGEFGLNFESSFKAKAAGHLFNEGITPVIISSGGSMWGA